MSSNWKYKIYDLRIESGYSSEVREFKLSRKEVERQISQLPYEFDNLRGDRYDSTWLPAMNLPFVDFITRFGFLPTEEQLIDYYKYYYEGTANTSSDLLSKIPQEAIYQRLHRAYPSFLRDFHFYVMASESNLFEKVAYSVREDVINKTDVLIEDQGRRLQVAIFLDTENSLDWAKSKNFDESKTFFVPVTMNEEHGYKVGKFYLVQPKTIEHLKEAIKLGIKIDCND